MISYLDRDSEESIVKGIRALPKPFWNSYATIHYVVRERSARLSLCSLPGHLSVEADSPRDGAHLHLVDRYTSSPRSSLRRASVYTGPSFMYNKNLGHLLIVLPEVSLCFPV